MNSSTNQVVYSIYQVTNACVSTGTGIIGRADSVWTVKGVYEDKELAMRFVDEKLNELKTMWGDKYEDECNEEWFYCYTSVDTPEAVH
jgi:hypothetical protein